MCTNSLRKTPAKPALTSGLYFIGKVEVVLLRRRSWFCLTARAQVKNNSFPKHPTIIPLHISVVSSIHNSSPGAVMPTCLTYFSKIYTKVLPYPIKLQIQKLILILVKAIWLSVKLLGRQRHPLVCFCCYCTQPELKRASEYDLLSFKFTHFTSYKGQLMLGYLSAEFTELNDLPASYLSLIITQPLLNKNTNQWIIRFWQTASHLN